MTGRAAIPWVCAFVLTCIVVPACGGSTTTPSGSGGKGTGNLEGDCGFSVSQADANQTIEAAGRDILVTVTAANGCRWTSANPSDFIAMVEGAAGSGNGSVKLRVSPNTGGQ